MSRPPSSPLSSPSSASRSCHPAVMVATGPASDSDRIAAQASGLSSQVADLKQRLADEHRDDREAYTEAKRTFIADALADAL